MLIPLVDEIATVNHEMVGINYCLLCCARVKWKATRTIFIIALFHEKREMAGKDYVGQFLLPCGRVWFS